MHHLGVGATHRGAPVLLLADDPTVTVIHLTTGEILATNTIDPDKTYCATTKRARPMAGLSRMSPMSRLICRLCRDSSQCAPGGIRTPDPLLRTEWLFH